MFMAGAQVVVAPLSLSACRAAFCKGWPALIDEPKRRPGFGGKVSLQCIALAAIHSVGEHFVEACLASLQSHEPSVGVVCLAIYAADVV